MAGYHTFIYYKHGRNFPACGADEGLMLVLLTLSLGVTSQGVPRSTRPRWTASSFVHQLRPRGGLLNKLHKLALCLALR